MMFARDKGTAENSLSDMDIGEFYALRPSYIYPVASRKEPNFSYKMMRFLYKPIISRMGINASITSTDLANAMFYVGINGTDKLILENRDLRTLAYIGR